MPGYWQKPQHKLNKERVMSEIKKLHLTQSEIDMLSNILNRLYQRNKCQGRKDLNWLNFNHTRKYVEQVAQEKPLKLID